VAPPAAAAAAAAAAARRRASRLPLAAGATTPATTTTAASASSSSFPSFLDPDMDQSTALAAAATEVRALTSRLAAAEAGADAAADAVSRAEAADATAADAMARLGARTPRPAPPTTGAGVKALVGAGARPDAGAAVAAAVAACRGWAPRDMAALLVGDDPTGANRGAAATNPDALGCLNGAWRAGSLTLASLAATLAEGKAAAAAAAAVAAGEAGEPPPLLAALPPGAPHGLWLEGRVTAGLTGARADALALFLCGCDAKGRPVPLEVYGTLPVRKWGVGGAPGRAEGESKARG